MKRFYGRFRIVLFAIALGLASVPFFQNLKENFTEIRVDLPKVESETPIFISPYVSLENETIVQDRNLSLYNFGGEVFSNCDNFEKDELKKCENDLIKARKFIWNHFQNKKLGYIILKDIYSPSPREYYYFIEPDKNDEWHIENRYTVSYAWGNQVYVGQYKSIKFWIDSESKERRLWFFNDLEMGLSSL